MSESFDDAITIIQAAIGDSSNPTFVRQCLNQAQREVARAHRWPELMSRGFFNTVAAFDDGTAAVTENDATVTITGGTLPADVATGFYRFALSSSSPWYGVRTRTDATNFELEEVYAQDTDAETDYILYKSHYSLPPTVDRVEEMWLHDGGTAVPLVNAATDQHLTSFQHYPSGPGVPCAYMNMERDAEGNRQVLLGPDTPDDVYRVEYVARRKVVDNTFAGNLDDSRWPVIVSRAKSLAYEPEFFDRSVVELKRYESLLAAEWANENESETQHVRVGQTRIDYPNRDMTAGILGRGVIEDPST